MQKFFKFFSLKSLRGFREYGSSSMKHEEINKIINLEFWSKQTNFVHNSLHYCHLRCYLDLRRWAVLNKVLSSSRQSIKKSPTQKNEKKNTGQQWSLFMFCNDHQGICTFKGTNHLKYWRKNSCNALLIKNRHMIS